jgi:predicted metal-dependent phosphoesterase TrpH
MFSVDFHTHTSASKDSLTSPKQLIQVARRRGLDRVVVTDHNVINGALVAHALDPELVIIGEEILTTCGEILAVYVIEEIPPGLLPQEAIRRLRNQGAFISVSHPFDAWRSGAWRLADLMEIAPSVDAIEIFNARCMLPGGNHHATKFAHINAIPGTAGSDAHTANELGAAKLVLPQFTGPNELRKVILEGKVKGGMSPFWVHFFSRYAHSHKKVV